jgi:hypothetical protein
MAKFASAASGSCAAAAAARIGRPASLAAVPGVGCRTPSFPYSRAWSPPVARPGPRTVRGRGSRDSPEVVVEVVARRGRRGAVRARDLHRLFPAARQPKRAHVILTLLLLSARAPDPALPFNFLPGPRLVPPRVCPVMPVVVPPSVLTPRPLRRGKDLVPKILQGYTCADEHTAPDHTHRSTHIKFGQ